MLTMAAYPSPVQGPAPGGENAQSGNLKPYLFLQMFFITLLYVYKGERERETGTQMKEIGFSY